MRVYSLVLLVTCFFVVNLYAEKTPNLVESIDKEPAQDSWQLEVDPTSSSPATDDLSSLTSELETKFVAYNRAKIIALNKITGQSQELTFKVGEAKYFGNIAIKIHKCLKDPTNIYSLENHILLTVTEERVDEEPSVLFQGWMMSSSIAIATFEHPVYEVFAKDCF